MRNLDAWYEAFDVPTGSGCISSPRPGARLVAEGAMRVTVCELPHETEALTAAWAALCEHTAAHASQLVLLPEFAMVEPVWEAERFDGERWSAIEALSAEHLRRLPDLRAEHVVGHAAVTGMGAALIRLSSGRLPRAGRLSGASSSCPTTQATGRRRWFERGDPAFPMFDFGA